LRLVLSKNKAALIDAIDELASSSDRPGIERWLKLLQSWLRDALLLQQNAQAPLLDDEKKSMDNFVAKFNHANLIACIQAVEKAIAHLDKNVYLHLILTTLAIDLREFYNGSTISMKSPFKRILITAALPYANGYLHLGHLAGAYLPADIYARYQRMKKRDVLFLCGSDEHGVAITVSAEKEKTTPKSINRPLPSSQ